MLSQRPMRAANSSPRFVNDCHRSTFGPEIRLCLAEICRAWRILRSRVAIDRRSRSLLRRVPESACGVVHISERFDVGNGSEAALSRADNQVQIPSCRPAVDEQSVPRLERPITPAGGKTTSR